MTALDVEKRQNQNIEGVAFLFLFCLTIPAANWMIGHVGTTCVSHGPCLLPVAPAVMAPSPITATTLRVSFRCAAATAMPSAALWEVLE